MVFTYPTKRITDKKEEYGSARWGYIRSLVKKHSNKDFFENKLFTQKTRMDIHGKIKNVNLHTVVIGGSGAVKLDIMLSLTLCSVIRAM